MTPTRQIFIATTLLLLAGGPFAAGPFVVGPVAAMGSDSGSSPSAAKSSTSDDYIEAQRKVKAEDYQGAIPILERILAQEPGNADALNYMGYSQRKLGNTTTALSYYLQALSNEPEHLGANEYLGELYLELGNVPKAEERLAVLQKVCSGCMEETELSEKIAAFKAKSS